MDVTLIQNLIWPVMLAFFRVAPLTLLPSVNLLARVPTQVRLAVTFAFAVLLGALGASQAAPLPTTQYALVLAALSELGLGLALVLPIHFALGALRSMGRMVDMQIGFGAAGIVDPTTDNAEAFLGSALAFTATVMFFLWDLHHEAIRGLAASTQIVPLGSGWAPGDPSWLGIALAEQFLLALMVVAPIVVVLFLLDLTIAYTSRLMPQVNIYFMSLPLKLAVGMLVAAATFAVAAAPIARAFERALARWPQILGG